MEDFDDSDLLIENIAYLTRNFKISRFYFADAYSIFLNELVEPFRQIAIYKKYDQDTFEIISRVIEEDGNFKNIFEQKDIKSLQDCLNITRKIIFGFDQIISLKSKLV
ncbi:MAG: hypothetical protein ACTSRZ_00245 [Promethearchaeota archaeon]